MWFPPPKSECVLSSTTQGKHFLLQVSLHVTLLSNSDASVTSVSRLFMFQELSAALCICTYSCEPLSEYSVSFSLQCLYSVILWRGINIFMVFSQLWEQSNLSLPTFSSSYFTIVNQWRFACHISAQTFSLETVVMTLFRLKPTSRVSGN